MSKPKLEITNLDWQVIADALDQRIIHSKEIERDLKNNGASDRLSKQFKLIQKRAGAVYMKLVEMGLI